MARNKQSSFNADVGLFDNLKNAQEVQEDCTRSTRGFTQEVQEVQEVYTRGTRGFTQQVQEVQQVKVIGSTQGKKGQKLKRINMAFSDANYEFITTQSRKMGISATAFVNYIIDKYRG